ncbi:unnamed protein product [Bursaphelenchus okinawaensis]|uniref:BTB domain-containing protein n=1 Tax=Bursaphelenchus okinawaensis TaxID=465554 RepID=A0A811L7T6_9BILA|nr:unnamed protein product [Bursaphelenchus okinawaensis]CAG9118281.1 unnamed protein product [Bursaphelenchus okinawaensis]
MCCKESYWHNVALNITRLRDEGLYCDLEIVCEDQVFNVHKVLMAAGVSYFRHMLRSGMLESTHNRVELTNVTPRALAAIVDFVYTGISALNNENAADILLAANFLMVDELQERCVHFFLTNVNRENCFKIWRIERELKLSTQLRQVVDEFVVDHFEDLYNSPDIGYLDYDGIEAFLKHDDLKVRNEDQVLIAALNWLQYDISQRVDMTHFLLRSIRFTYLSNLDDTINNIKEMELKFAITEFVARNLPCPSSQKPIELERYYPSGVLVCLGGRKTKPNPCEFVELFGGKSNKWKFLQSLPVAGRQVGVTVIGCKVYMIGGHAGRYGDACSGVLDVKTGEYVLLPPLLEPCRGMGVTQLDSHYVYAIGGTDESRSTSFSHVQRYDVNTGEWEMIAPLLKARRNVNAMAVGNRVYAIGGCTQEEETSYVNTVECYDPEKNQWEEAPPMNVARFSAGAAAIGNRLYVVGGFNDGALRDCEYFDTITKTWHKIASLRTARGGVAVDAMGGRLYAVGGYNGHYLKSTEVYDPIKDEWTAGPCLHDARAGCGVARVPLVEDEVTRYSGEESE